MGQSVSLAAGGRIIEGAPVLTSNQVSIPVTAGGTLLIAANQGRRNILFRNLDTTNPVYIQEGPTAATTTGFLVKAGESIQYTYKGQFVAISTGGSVTVSYAEESSA